MGGKSESMNSQVNPKVTFGCFTIIIIVILLVAYQTTASLNPLAVYKSDNILAKIIVSLLAVLLASSLLQMLFVYMVRKSVEMGAHRPAQDVICPGCGLPLLQFSSSHGAPFQCPNCKKYWHYGPACYNKDLPPGTGLIHFCPRCLSDAAQDRDLFDDGGFTRSM